MKHVVHIFRKHLCSLVYVWYINIRCMHDVRNVGIWSTNESLFIYLISFCYCYSGYNSCNGNVAEPPLRTFIHKHFCLPSYLVANIL